MKYLIETFDDVEVETITEAATGKKDYFISGTFMECDTKNRNGRIYPAATMEKALAKYIKEWVEPKRALGELNHPERLNVDPKESAILITSLKMEGTKVVGKAKVLDTPNGRIVKGLLEAGVQLGVSSRGAGSLKESNGTRVVQDDFHLSTVDVVIDPSANAYVNPVMESKEFIMENGQFLEVSEELLVKMGYAKKEAIVEEVVKESFEEKLLRSFGKLQESSKNPRLEHAYHSKKYNEHLKSIHQKASKLAGHDSGGHNATDTTLDEIRTHVKEMEKHHAEMKALKKHL